MQPCGHGSATPGNDQSVVAGLSDDEASPDEDGQESRQMSPPPSEDVIEAKAWDHVVPALGQAQRDHEAAIK